SSTAAATTDAQPIAAGTSGQAAAVAPALEKNETVGLKAASLPPMVTNEPIVDSRFSEPFTRPQPDTPTFAGNITHRESGSGMKFASIARILLVVGVSGYFGCQKPPPMHYLQHLPAKHSTTASQPAETAAASPASPVVPALPQPQQEPSVSTQPEIEI